ncbi:hypothetical protein OAG71_02070 [bacterium]|nr:hypothetical protein [bacterium]
MPRQQLGNTSTPVDASEERAYPLNFQQQNQFLSSPKYRRVESQSNGTDGNRNP